MPLFGTPSESFDPAIVRGIAHDPQEDNEHYQDGDIGSEYHDQRQAGFPPIVRLRFETWVTAVAVMGMNIVTAFTQTVLWNEVAAILAVCVVLFMLMDSRGKGDGK